MIIAPIESHRQCAHKYIQLFARIYTVFIDFSIVLCSNEIECSIITERTPFRVDQYVFLVRLTVKILRILDLFHVASIAAGSCVANLFHSFMKIGDAMTK